MKCCMSLLQSCEQNQVPLFSPVSIIFTPNLFEMCYIPVKYKEKT